MKDFIFPQLCRKACRPSGMGGCFEFSMVLQGCRKVLSPTRKETSKCYCQNGVNFLRRLVLREKGKKKWWQFASPCCWNRARPLHASELISFLVGLKTYQRPDTEHVSFIVMRTASNSLRKTLDSRGTDSSDCLVPVTLFVGSVGLQTEDDKRTRYTRQALSLPAIAMQLHHKYSE